MHIHPLPDDKMSALPKLKAFADDKSNVTQNIKVALHRIEKIVEKEEAFADDKSNITQNIKVEVQRIENIVGKEENAGYQHFLLYLQCFQTAFSSSASKVVIVNPFPASPCFYVSAVYTSLLKTLWKKVKLLVTSNFSFFHSVFYPFGELPIFSIKY